MHFDNLEPIEHKPNPLYSDLRIQQDEISKQFDAIKEWKEIWDEYGFQRPNDLTISHAETVIEKLLDLIISTDYRFITPFISGDGDGNVTVIWYNQKRQLHFKIGENDVQYFKVWGTNIDTEMEVDFLKSEHCLDLWKWLIKVKYKNKCTLWVHWT